MPDTNPTPRAVALTMMKGGYGKTPLARELTTTLSLRGHDTLLVDTDPEGHLSTSFGYTQRKIDGDDLSDVLINGAAPDTIIRDTEWGFDLIPAHNLERVKSALDSATASDRRMERDLVDPLLGTEYDYILFDTPGSNNDLVTNAIVAAKNVILPLRPDSQAASGLRGVMQKLIGPLREYGMEVDVLAATPTRMSQTITTDTAERRLVTSMNQGSAFAANLMAGIDGADPSAGTLPDGVTVADVADIHIPPYARITDDEWERIDNGDHHRLPGLRESQALDDAHQARMPLAAYAPEADILEDLTELADIIERGGIVYE